MVLLHITFADVLEAQAWATRRSGACGEPGGVHPVDMAKPSEVALTQHGEHAGGMSTFQDFCIGNFILA